MIRIIISIGIILLLVSKIIKIKLKNKYYVDRDRVFNVEGVKPDLYRTHTATKYEIDLTNIILLDDDIIEIKK